MDSADSHEMLLGTFIINPKAIALIVACGFLTLLWKCAQVDHDPREPVVVSHSIPYFGHLTGIVKHGLRYYQIIL